MCNITLTCAVLASRLPWCKCHALHGSAAPLCSHVAPDKRVLLQAAQLWQGITGPQGSQLTSQHARAFYQRLDWSHVLGWPRHRTPCANHADALRFKAAHPAKLVALRLTPRQPFSLLGVDALVATELLQIKGEQLATKCGRFLIQSASLSALLSLPCAWRQTLTVAGLMLNLLHGSPLCERICVAGQGQPRTSGNGLHDLKPTWLPPVHHQGICRAGAQGRRRGGVPEVQCVSCQHSHGCAHAVHAAPARCCRR